MCDPRIHDKLLCGISNIIGAVVKLALQQRDAGNYGKWVAEIPVNYSVIIEEMDMMMIANAEKVNEHDAAFEADVDA